MEPREPQPVSVRCPTCRQVMRNFTEVLFTSNYTVILEGECCGAVITSGELNILALMPHDEKERRH